MTKSQVLILRTDFDAIELAISQVFNHFHINSDVRSIVIKPNLCSLRTPETGTVTHPLVLGGLLRYLRLNYPRSDIIVAESDSTSRYAESVFSGLGIYQLASKHGARCVNLSADVLEHPKNGLALSTVKAWIPRTLKEADLLISVPKLKTHTTTKLTCALKNQFGCLPEKKKSVYHGVLNNAIAECNELFKPDIVLVDGIIGLVGPGPIVGFPIKSQLVVAGLDPVAVDTACARILGLNPRFVGHITRSATIGVGSMSYEAVGLHPEEVKVKSKLSHVWHRVARMIQKDEHA